MPGRHFAAARYGRFLFKNSMCISRLHWAASNLVYHNVYIENNALLQKQCFLTMLSGGGR